MTLEPRCAPAASTASDARARPGRSALRRWYSIVTICAMSLWSGCGGGDEKAGDAGAAGARGGGDAAGSNAGAREGRNGAKEGAPAAPAAPREVRVSPASEIDLEKTVLVTGTLAADERVIVSTKVTGRLEAISVDLGSPVKRGQVIARVEPTDYKLRVEQATSALEQARVRLGAAPGASVEQVSLDDVAVVREARASLEEARANLDRSRALADEGLIARADLDTANASFVRAETALQSAVEEARNRQALVRQRSSELQLARQQLSDAQIRAPMDGIVEARQVSAGEYLAIGGPLVTLVKVDPLRLRAEVPERDAGGMRVDQEIRVRVEGDPTTYVGRVARLSPTITEQSRVLIVEGEIANPGGLRPGSFARAEIVVDRSTRAVAVPTSSIVTFAGLQKVITIESGKAVEKPVQTGRRSGDLTEIVSGLKAGEPVVLEPGNLQQGQAVVVMQGASGRATPSPAAAPAATD